MLDPSQMIEKFREKEGTFISYDWLPSHKLWAIIDWATNKQATKNFVYSEKLKWAVKSS